MDLIAGKFLKITLSYSHLRFLNFFYPFAKLYNSSNQFNFFVKTIKLVLSVSYFR